MAWMFLALAIGAEVSGTLALKASEGFTRLLPSFLVVAGYATAFALLALALRTFPVGVSYAIWSGLGTVGAAVGGLLLFGEKLLALVILGIVIVIAGVVMITLGEVAN